MPSPFDITVTGDTIRLEAGRAQTTITVTNNSGRPMRARAEILPAKPEAAAWLSIASEAERQFPPAATEQFVVKVSVPQGTSEGEFSFVLRVADIKDPNENFTDGPVLKFSVAATPPPPPPPPPPKLWLFILLGVVFLLAVVGVTIWVLTRNSGVPDVVGYTYEEAEQRLEREDLMPRKVLKRATAEEQGKVIAQDPAAGADAPADGVVTLDVGSQRIRLPDLRGENALKAVEALNEMGLFLIKVIPTSTGGRGARGLATPTVVSQDPPPTIEVVPESTITLTVQENAISPPDVRRRALGTAVQALRDAGFLCCWIKTTNEGGSDFEVVDQDPPIGTPTSRANKIKLVIRQGPSEAALKDLMQEYKVDMEPR